MCGKDTIKYKNRTDTPILTHIKSMTSISNSLFHNNSDCKVKSF
jgi:hypothetical protein